MQHVNESVRVVKCLNVLKQLRHDEAASAGAGARVYSRISRDSDFFCHIVADIAHCY